MPRTIAAVVLCGLLLSSGCGDDGVFPSAFSLTVGVVDPSGAPVPGLMLSVVADLPYYQDGRTAEKAACVIPFSMSESGRARLCIEDAEGTVVRQLVDGLLPAGRHQVVWNGLDDAGSHAQSGAYSARMKVTAMGTDSLLFEERMGMYMAILSLNLDHAGVTDQAGRIRLTDRRLFPSLLDVEDMEATDENGRIIGDIVFDGSMRFTFVDTASDKSMRFTHIVTGSENVSFVWDPPSVAQDPEDVPVGARMDELPPGTYSLGPVYPNPFN